MVNKISISYASRIIFQKYAKELKFLKFCSVSKYTEARTYAKIPRALVIYATVVQKTYVGA